MSPALVEGNAGRNKNTVRRRKRYTTSGLKVGHDGMEWSAREHDIENLVPRVGWDDIARERERKSLQKREERWRKQAYV